MSPAPSKKRPQVDIAVAFLGALVAITCAAGMRPTPQAASGQDAPAVTSGKPTQPAGASPSAQERPTQPPRATPTLPSGATAPSAAKQKLPALAKALAGLSSGAQHVRIAWLGDSHTYADFWPQAVRRRLQAKYGRGGPGLLLLGVKPYRHDQATVRVQGKWRREPSSPSSSAKQLDGIFGLAGQRSVPVSADARCDVTLRPGVAQGRVRWVLHFRAPAGAAWGVSLGSGEITTVADGKTIPGSPILRREFETDAGETFSIRALRGAPEVFGVVVETTKPGVVVDNLGINGARAGTTAAWQDDVHAAEIGNRRPDLVVMAYGTNEAASALSTDRIEAHFAALHQRVRRGAPDADCLFIGPTDMADEAGGSRPRVPEVDAAVERAARTSGCGYLSAFRLMGGEGGFARWAKESPPLASPDRIHLTPKGYERLGQLIFERLSLP